MCPVGNKVRKNSAIKSNKNKNLRYRYGSMLVDIEETVIRLLGSGRNKIMKVVAYNFCKLLLKTQPLPGFFNFCCWFHVIFFEMLRKLTIIFLKLNIFRKLRNAAISSSQWNVSVVSIFELFKDTWCRLEMCLILGVTQKWKCTVLWGNINPTTDMFIELQRSNSKFSFCCSAGFHYSFNIVLNFDCFSKQP